MKNLSFIFLWKEMYEKIVICCGRKNFRVSIFKLFWFVIVLVYQFEEWFVFLMNQ